MKDYSCPVDTNQNPPQGGAIYQCTILKNLAVLGEEIYKRLSGRENTSTSNKDDHSLLRVWRKCTWTSAEVWVATWTNPEHELQNYYIPCVKLLLDQRCQNHLLHNGPMSFHKLISQILKKEWHFHSQWWLGVAFHLLVLVHFILVQSQIYKDILEYIRLLSAAKLCRDADLIFQQDSASDHTSAKSSNAGFNVHGVTVFGSLCLRV